MNNLKQITNFDLEGCAITTKVIRKGGNKGNIISYDYIIIPSSLLKSQSIYKMGYCTEPKGLNYPIFLTLNGVETEFQLGKTGMFEFQEEHWTNINNENSEEYLAKVFCSEVKVPKDIHFTLDYFYEV